MLNRFYCEAIDLESNYRAEKNLITLKIVFTFNKWNSWRALS